MTTEPRPSFESSEEIGDPDEKVIEVESIEDFDEPGPLAAPERFFHAAKEPMTAGQSQLSALAEGALLPPPVLNPSLPAAMPAKRGRRSRSRGSAGKSPMRKEGGRGRG